MISIIVPTYNEKESVPVLIERISKCIDTSGAELIIVDDNSPDETWKVVEKIKNKEKWVRLLKRDGKRGLTSAILDGMKLAKSNDIIVMDADLSHPPEKIMEVAKNLDDFDLVICSRSVKGGGVENWPLHRKLISQGATMLAKVLLGIKCSDPMSGFFGVKKSVVEKTVFKTKGYKILLNILAQNRKLKIKEIPYVFRDRYAGKTKLGSGEMITFVFDLIALMH